MNERTPPAPPAPPNADDALCGRIIDGRYRILSRLGAGGMGAVYRGERVEIKKPVAIKVLHGPLAATDEFRRRFEREARAASRLSHAGCVSVIDFGRVATIEPPGDGAFAGIAYLVMELVRGVTLGERLDQGRIPPAEAVVIARGVLSALRHAHDLGLIHRDIKPGNIMLPVGAGTGTPVKLLDFGLAKQMLDDGEPATAPLTAVGMVCGTPTYLSPEQAQGKPADARSDLYSLGVVLFEMVCGAPPFVAADAIGIVRAHLGTPAPRPRDRMPSLSRPLEAAILKALEKDPAARFASAEQFQAALAACPEAAISSVTTPASRTVWPRRRIAVVALALAATGALGTVVALSRRSSAPSPSVAALAPSPAPAPRAISPGARRAHELVSQDRVEEAILAARAAIAHSPHDGAAHAALGAAYQSKLWCSDAIDELDKALRDDPILRGDPDLVRRAISCLHGKTQARAERFLVEEIGAGAVGPLRAAASSDPNPDVRRGAERALERVSPLR